MFALDDSVLHLVRDRDLSCLEIWVAQTSKSLQEKRDNSLVNDEIDWQTRVDHFDFVHVQVFVMDGELAITKAH